MAKFSIISREFGIVRYTGCPTFTGTYMKPGVLEFREIASDSPIPWQVGDYVDYTRTGLRYSLYNTPQVKKQAKSGKYGGAFVYQNVQFFDRSKQLEICIFRDLVPDDNSIHFSTQETISVFDNVAGIAERLQTCLQSLYGSTSWVVRVATRAETYNALVAMGTSTADATTAADEYEALVEEDRDFSISAGATIIECLDKIYEIWTQVGWVFRVEDNVATVVIGGGGLSATEIYSYGHRNGLTAITRTPANADELANVIYAYGSTRNMIPRWYNSLTIKDADSVDIPNLMLPVSSWGTTEVDGVSLPDADKAYLVDTASSSRIGPRPRVCYFDGGGDLPEIYPTIQGMTIGNIRARKGSYYEDTEYIPDTSIYTDDERVDKILSVNSTFDSGLVAQYGKAVTNIRPTYIVFPEESGTVSESTVVLQLGSVSTTIPVSGRFSATFKVSNGHGYITTSLDVQFRMQVTLDGTMVYDTALDSSNILNQWRLASNEIQMSNGFLSDAGQTVVFGLYCRITGAASGNTYSIGEMYADFSADVTMVRQTTFSISLRQLGFDISEMAALGDGKSISMRSGKCAGRSFTINDVQYDSTNDSWELTCERSEDESLAQLFPNDDYPVAVDDEFVLLDIAMPKLYIYYAEQNLLSAAQQLLDDVSIERWQYVPEIDAEFMVENNRIILPGQNMLFVDPDIAIEEKGGSYLLTSDGVYFLTNTGERILLGGGEIINIIVDSVAISEGEFQLPTYKVTLRDRKRIIKR